MGRWVRVPLIIWYSVNEKMWYNKNSSRDKNTVLKKQKGIIPHVNQIKFRKEFEEVMKEVTVSNSSQVSLNHEN